MNTGSGFTRTSKGDVAHVRHSSGRFDMPVRLDFTARRKDGKKPFLYPPLTVDGDYVYALPGGSSLKVTASQLKRGHL